MRQKISNTIDISLRHKYCRYRRKLRSIQIGILLIILIFTNTKPIIFAENQESTFSISDQTENNESEKDILESIKTELRSAQRDFNDTTREIDKAKENLKGIEREITTLSDQIKNLDDQIETTESLIYNVDIQITEKENELLLLYEDQEIRKIALENQKQMLEEYLGALYDKESAVSSNEKNNSINITKMLLSDNAVGEQLQEMKYFNILEDTGYQMFEKLEKIIKALEQDEKNIESKKIKLAGLENSLEEEKNNLHVQKEAKKNLLEQTRGEEKIYKNLLEESKKQQAGIQDELEKLRDDLTFIEKEINELGSSFNPDNYTNFFSGEKISVYEYIASTKNNDSSFRPQWPVTPSQGISAYFKDPGYRRFFQVDHDAIDIPKPQSTPIHAPADGVVYKISDNGFGYSYLMIAHEGGFMTLYGHVSAFKVGQGQKVHTGDIIALSGATPGTKGAGFMTTGPHLHFEILKNQKRVDPLYYLPLSVFPKDKIPAKYKAKAEMESIEEANRQKVKRILDVPEPTL